MVCGQAPRTCICMLTQPEHHTGKQVVTMAAFCPNTRPTLGHHAAGYPTWVAPCHTQHRRSRRRFNSNTVHRHSTHERMPFTPARAQHQPHQQPKYSIPQSILDSISRINSAWADYAVQHPLREPNLNAQIVLLGVTNFAPLQQQAVQQALQSMQPQAVALEMPAALPGQQGQSSVVLPYPYVVQLLLDALDESEGGALDLGSPAAHQLLQDLSDPTLGQQAKLGKDVMDPFEAVGFYPAVDLLLRPEQAALVAQLFGYVPGEEQAYAVRAALAAEAQVVCADASIRMQEAWVAAMTREWSLKESDLGRQLLKELEAAQQLVPAVHVAWDEQLAGQVMHNTRGAATDGNREQQELEALLAFKVCRACAAALIQPGQDAAAAVTAQATLQPLKFTHFEKRALHMAVQLRELCRWRAAQSILVRPHPAPTDKTNAQVTDGNQPGQAADTAAGQTELSNEPAGAVSVQAQQEGGRGATGADDTAGTDTANESESAETFTVLAVVGRQYIPMIEMLWNDPNSALWRGDVPRTFAASTVEPIRRPIGDMDPDTASGGSRPVGQKVIRLG